MTTQAQAVRDHHHVIETGDVALAVRCVGPDHVNREAPTEAPAARRQGPAGLAASAAWLRFAFSDMHFEEHDLIEDGETVIYHVTWSGQHTGPFVLFEGDHPVQVFPPTGRSFGVEQFHRYRLHAGATVEHLAVRDDLGLLRQLGYIPPTPAAVLRILAWRLTGRARRAGEKVAALAAQAAAEADALQTGGTGV